MDLWARASHRLPSSCMGLKPPPVGRISTLVYITGLEPRVPMAVAGRTVSFLDTGATCSVLSSLDPFLLEPAPLWELLVSQFLNISLRFQRSPERTYLHLGTSRRAEGPLQEGKPGRFIIISAFSKAVPIPRTPYQSGGPNCLTILKFSQPCWFCLSTRSWGWVTPIPACGSPQHHF